MLARAALAQRDVSGAVDRFEEGLGVLAPADPERRWSCAFAAADAMYELGSSAGLNDALAVAIRLHEYALAAAPRARVPLQSAMTQNDLSIALATLGKRESGTARLEQAVEAYWAALQERTRAASRSTGPVRKTISAMRFKGSASAKAALLVLSRPSKPFRRRCWNGQGKRSHIGMRSPNAI